MRAVGAKQVEDPRPRWRQALDERPDGRDRAVVDVHHVARRLVEQRVGSRIDAVERRRGEVIETARRRLHARSLRPETPGDWRSPLGERRSRAAPSTAQAIDAPARYGTLQRAEVAR